MTKNIKKIFQYYRIFRTPGMFNEDLKLFKRFNMLLQKYYNTEKEIYLKEANNVLITLSNIFDVTKTFISDVDELFIETQHKKRFQDMIQKIT